MGADARTQTAPRASKRPRRPVRLHSLLGTAARDATRNVPSGGSQQTALVAAPPPARTKGRSASARSASASISVRSYRNPPDLDAGIGAKVAGQKSYPAPRPVLE